MRAGKSRTSVARAARCGLTMVELVIAMTMLTVILGAVVLAATSGGNAYNTGRSVSELETQAQRILDRIVAEVRQAGRAGLFPDPQPPFGSSSLDFQTNVGFQGGAVQWSDPIRISIEPAATDPDDGVDNDSNGLVDECSVVWRRNPGAADEERVVWGSYVRELLEGEVANGVDDNGNGLIDERGLCFVINASTLTIRLTLERRDPDGRLITRTVETAVTLRN
jgi:type II secretory pathway pseudopilin PulG